MSTRSRLKTIHWIIFCCAPLLTSLDRPLGALGFATVNRRDVAD